MRPRRPRPADWVAGRVRLLTRLLVAQTTKIQGGIKANGFYTVPLTTDGHQGSRVQES